MLALYIITGFIALLALVAVFAQHKALGDSYRFPVPHVDDALELRDEDILDAEDLEDTCPHIRLPFFKSVPPPLPMH